MAVVSQRLDFVVAIGAWCGSGRRARRACGRRAGRHAEEGAVGLLARLRPVGEGRMLLGVGEVQRLGLGRDDADEALAEAQRRLVHRPRASSPRWRRARARRRRAARRTSRPRPPCSRRCRDDLVEPVLRLERLRHDLAQPVQQHARTGGLSRIKRLSLDTSLAVPETCTPPAESGDTRYSVVRFRHSHPADTDHSGEC